MDETMTDRLARIFPYLLIVPAVLPLIYMSGLVYPYVTTKTFLLQGFGIVTLAAFVYLALNGRSFFYRRLSSPATWIPALLLIVAYGTSVFGIDFYRSFWGLFDRGDGLLTMTLVTVFFYLILLSADYAFSNRLIKTISIVAGVVAAIAVLQWVTTVLGGKVWFLPPVSGRIGSTFGNAAFLSGYLGMTLFVIFFALKDAVGVWRHIYASAATLSVLAILFAATRGTMLALLAALLIALVYAAFKGEGSVRRFGRYSLVAVIFLIALFFGFRNQLAHAPFEPVRRIASISLSDGTVASRLFVWQHIGEEALRRPLLGYGAEHIDQLFDRIYDPSLIVEQWFDRSHNAFLDYFAQYGILGLAFYLALIGAFAVSALRLYRRDHASLINSGFLFLLLILVYAVQNFFVFDTPSSLWLLYVLFAFLLVTLSNAPATSLSLRPPLGVTMTVSAFFALLIIPAVILPLYANIMLTRGYLYHLIDVNRANAYFERGLALGTFADLEYGYQAYTMYTDHQAIQLSGKDRIAAYDYAFSLLSANFEKYPYDARTATYLGHVIDTAPPEITINDTFDKQVLARAIELSPLRAQAWYMTANISLRKADALSPNDSAKEKYFRMAIITLETYAQKEPTLPVPRYILATLYYKLGDTTTAKKWADEAYPLYTTPDAAAAGPAVKYYLATEDWQHAARFLADLSAENPSDYEMLYDLAKVTYLAGDPAAALRIVVGLRESDPAILETDQNFLNAITAYERSAK
jgi:O-antigen ligase